MSNNFDPSQYNNSLLTTSIPGQDFVTVYINDVINYDFEKLIYKSVQDKTFEDGIYQNFVGHIAYAIDNKEIKNFLNSSINKIAKENNIISDKEELILTECSFAKYTPKYGNLPKLFPHFDTHKLDGQRLTLDIQLLSNIEWPVVVEGNSFNIAHRDAILFYGTQQIHWREKRNNFKEEDFTDMLFCHFKFFPQRDWSNNQKEVLEYRSHRIRELVGINNQPEEFGIIDKKDNK
jgi:hypothetical protein